MNELEQLAANQAAQAEMNGVMNSLVQRCVTLAAELAVTRQKLAEAEKNNKCGSSPEASAS